MQSDFRRHLNTFLQRWLRELTLLSYLGLGVSIIEIVLLFRTANIADASAPPILVNLGGLLFLATTELQSSEPAKSQTFRWLAVLCWWVFIAISDRTELQRSHVFHGSVMAHTSQLPDQRLFLVGSMFAVLVMYGLVSVSLHRLYLAARRDSVSRAHDTH
jgi:hypothetical protein